MAGLCSTQEPLPLASKPNTVQKVAGTLRVPSAVRVSRCQTLTLPYFTEEGNNSALASVELVTAERTTESYQPHWASTRFRRVYLGGVHN